MSSTRDTTPAIFAFFYGGFIAYGGVKMQMLEPYRWSMTSSIMAMVPSSAPLALYLGLSRFEFEAVIMALIPGTGPWILLCLPAGISALAVLTRPQVEARYAATA